MSLISKYYLGLDLSLSSPGYAVVQVRNRQAYLIEKGHVTTNAKQSHGQRLRRIEKALSELRNKYKYEVVIRERGFSRFPSTTQALFKVVGLSDLVFATYGEIVEIPPTTVKKAITGKGKAEKSEVAKEVRKLLRLDDKTKFANDDESDAAGVCLTYLLQNNLINREDDIIV